MGSQARADVAAQLDVSAVRTDSSDDVVALAVDLAKRFDCYLVTVLPSQTGRARELLGTGTPVRLGGNVGFPSGGQTTRTKVRETTELVELGVDEIDVVIDVAAHLSGRTAHVADEIHAVVEAAAGLPVKAILECHYLDDDQILAACDLAVDAGVAFVKTGTGWAPSGATLHNVGLIARHVGHRVGVKASGGIRDVETIDAMRGLGATRFGVAATHVAEMFGVAG